MLNGGSREEPPSTRRMATFQVIKSTKFLVMVEKFLKLSDGKAHVLFYQNR